MEKAVLSLGSCMGDSRALLKLAEEELSRLPDTRVAAQAPLYETEAVDVPDKYAGTIFLNTVVVLETALPCDDLSRAIHAIEDRLGRVRTGERHAPRTIDIDLIAYGDVRSNRDDLRLPHPEAARRRFVMEPLAEIWPDFVLPGETRTAAQIRDSLPLNPAVRRLPTS